MRKVISHKYEQTFIIQKMTLKQLSPQTICQNTKGNPLTELVLKDSLKNSFLLDYIFLQAENRAPYIKYAVSP